MRNIARKHIEWTKIGEDDWVGKYPGIFAYMLRAESMGEWWWWCVYRNDEEIANCYNSKYREAAMCERVAKLRAVVALNRWRKNNL